MRTLRTSLVVLALASGCVQSALNPGDKVTVTGSALQQDKSPLANAELQLLRDGTSACLIPGSFQKPKTDAQGNFSLQLTGADTQNGDNARCFRLGLPTSSAGAQVRADFLMQVTAVQVPPLQVWNGAVSGTQVAAGTQLAFTDLSVTHGLNSLAFSASVQGADGQVWTQTGVASPVAFSDAVLEDFAATASVLTDHPVKGSGTTFTFTYQSDGVLLPTRKLVPFSRGAACAYTGAPAVCPLTDGKLSAGLASTADKPVSELTVTLAAPHLLSKAVLRNARFQGAAAMLLEGSADGVVWNKLADVSPSAAYQELTLAGVVPVNQVRLKGTAMSSSTLALSLDELSLF